MLQIEESQGRFWAAFCKIMATTAIVFGGGWTVYTYLQTRASEVKTAAVEARKPFLDKALELYLAAASAVAPTPTSAGPQKVVNATEEFWQLNGGHWR